MLKHHNKVTFIINGVTYSLIYMMPCCQIIHNLDFKTCEEKPAFFNLFHVLKKTS